MSEQPKLFHALTSMPKGASSADVEALIANRLILKPPVMRGMFSQTGILDQLAGDGRYLFFAPLKPLTGLVASGKPTFMFDAHFIFRRYPTAIRVRDLGSSYPDVGQFSKIDNKIKSDDFVLNYSDRSPEFEMIARVGTQTDKDKAWEILKHLAGQSSYSMSSLRPSMPSNEEIDGMVELCAKKSKKEEFRSELYRVLHRIHDNWLRINKDAEVLVADAVPLKEAEAWSMDLRNWTAL